MNSPRSSHTVLLASVLALPLAACPSTASTTADAGTSSQSDASSVPDASAGATGGREGDPSANFDGCFNGIDEDGEGGLDCADLSCNATPPCCIGSTNPLCCAPSGPVQTLALKGCLDASRCGPMRLVAGFPEIASGRIAMVSSGDTDAIVDFPTWAVTPRAERVILRATVSTRTNSTLALDAIAFGLWPSPQAATTVTPDIAVIISATRGDVSLVVGSRIVSSRDLSPRATHYALEVTPEGRVTLQAYAEDELLETQDIEIELPLGRTVPVVFGRVTNNETGAASLSDFSVERHPCDIPSALTPTGELTFRDVPDFDTRSVTDPSVLVHQGVTRIAFAARRTPENAGRSLYIGTLVGAEILDVRSVATEATVNGATDLSGPSLQASGESMEMYFAYRTEGSWALGLLRDVLGVPSFTPLNTGESYDDPALLGSALLVRQRTATQTRFVRVDRPNGETDSFTSAPVCGADATCESGTRNSDYVLQNSGEELAFDRDEIGAPAVVQTASTTRIFYAGRRGTRWSIGMLQAASSGLYFRESNGGEALLAGSGTGRDALSVASPTAWVADGVLHLVYAGSDGVGWSLFHASQPIRGD